LEFTILERLSGGNLTVESMADGSSGVWYSEDLCLEKLSAQKISILLKQAPVEQVFYYEENLSKSSRTPP
jgi:hypothetical protein